jgi:DNA modification methylase
MTDIGDNSVHCVVTSPPYYGLRIYKGLEDLTFGGWPDCPHTWSENIIVRNNDKTAGSKQNTNIGSIGRDEPIKTNVCSLCGAWRGQLGSEPTIEMFIAHLVEVFQEVKRVLRPDGVCWVNMGDSMASGKGTCFNPGGSDGRNTFAGIQTKKENGVYPLDRGNISELRAQNLKPLDALLVPFRLALALQADGWYVREDIIWNKNNPMPESLNGWRWEKQKVKVDNIGRGTEPKRAVYPDRPTQDHDGKDFKQDAVWQDCPGCPKCLPTDGLVLRQGNWRPTNAHEYIFMLTKSDNYFCDREAVKEAWKFNEYDIARAEDGSYKYNGKHKDGYDTNSQNNHRNAHCTGQPIGTPSTGRNLRSVWNFSTMGYPGAHFATFPIELPLRCIKASTSKVGVCSKCGKPWSRVIENAFVPQQDVAPENNLRGIGNQKPMDESNGWQGAPRGSNDSKTIEWRPSCRCNAPAVPSIVLDPFAGSGTTLAAAKSLGHIGIGYELSTEYLPMIRQRLQETPEGELSCQLSFV